MKHFSQQLGVLIAILSTFLPVSAYDFEVDGLRYTITSISKLEVEVDGPTDGQITSVTIPSIVEYKGKSLIVRTIGRSAFYMYENLETVIISDSITGIDSRAFSGCTRLKKVELPKYLNYLGGFTDCKSLTKITLPNTVICIYDDCFLGCTNLASVTLPSSLKEIGEYAFYGCKSLHNLDIPDSVESIGRGAFAHSGLKNLKLPKSLATISNGLIWGCNLDELYLPNKIEGFPFDTFRHSTNNDLCWDIYTLLNYYFSDPKQHTGITNPASVKRIIIGDGPNPFSLKTTFVEILDRPYSNVHHIKNPALDNINYIYVGRTLDIKSFDYGSYPVRYVIDSKKGVVDTLEFAGSCDTPYFIAHTKNLILGPHVRRFDCEWRESFVQDTLQSIVCKSFIPPTVKFGDDTFKTNVYIDAVLYVPKGCKEAYMKAPVWKNFWNIQELGSPIDAAVDEIATDNKDDKYCVYNLQGVLVKSNCEMNEIYELPKGLYIITSKTKRQKIKI